MKYLFIAKVIIVFTIFSLGNTLNLEKAQNVADSNSLDSSNNTLSGTRNDGATKQVKGNIGSIASIISNPTQIINQIQATVNTFLTTLNNTLSGGSTSNITSLLGSLKNKTNTASGSLRLEDADLVLSNISEIFKTSTQAKAELISNASIEFENQLHGAYEDIRKAILELKSSIHENSQGEESSSLSPALETETGTSSDTTSSSSTVAPERISAKDEQKSSENRDKSGLRSMVNQLSSIHSQVDSRIQRSISNAHSTIQESIDIARQSTQIMRNQTSSFMNDVQRVFNEMSAPIRQFFDQLRRGIGTAVISA